MPIGARFRRRSATTARKPAGQRARRRAPAARLISRASCQAASRSLNSTNDDVGSVRWDRWEPTKGSSRRRRAEASRDAASPSAGIEQRETRAASNGGMATTRPVAHELPNVIASQAASSMPGLASQQNSRSRSTRPVIGAPTGRHRRFAAGRGGKRLGGAEGYRTRSRRPVPRIATCPASSAETLNDLEAALASRVRPGPSDEQHPCFLTDIGQESLCSRCIFRHDRV